MAKITINTDLLTPIECLDQMVERLGGYESFIGALGLEVDPGCDPDNFMSLGSVFFMEYGLKCKLEMFSTTGVFTVETI